MKKLWSLLAFLLLFGCHPKENRESLSCIQLTNRNGFNETIGTKERLLAFQNTNFQSSQPYSQVLRIYKKTAEGKTPSIVTTYHPNGLPYQYLEIIDGRACGAYREWHANGQLKIEARVVGGGADLSAISQKDWLFDGTCKCFDAEGNILSEIPYEKGSLEGTAVYYFPNGTIQKKISYAHNELHGNWVEFSLKGTLIQQSSFSKGKKEGISLGFWNNETPCFFEEYEGDLLKRGEYFSSSSQRMGGVEKSKGQRVLFQKDGSFEIIDYVGGLPEGEIKSYNAKELLSHLYHVKNEQKEGEELFFWPSSFAKPIPKLSLFWEEGMIHGTIKSWYENGSLESQKEFRRNKKNGPSSYWYPNGSLMMIEEYEEDLLQEGKYFKPHQSSCVSTVSKGEGEATLFDKDGIFLRKIHYHKGKPHEPSQ